MTDSTITPSYHFKNLKNASVFITGGGSGIGAALTEGFLAQGAKVAFVDISDATPFCEHLESRYSCKPLFIPCDIRDIGVLQTAIDQAREAHGPITILVNNAAQDTRHNLDSLSVEEWDNSIATNLRPQFFTAQAVANDMKQAKQGAIINLSSNSFLLGLSGYPAYVTAKAGIMGLTKALARELGSHGIRVNSLVPGWVMTDRQKKLWVTPEALDECLAEQCLKETIAPEDIAASCLFLASDAARMITGQALIVDGGRA